MIDFDKLSKREQRRQNKLAKKSIKIIESESGNFSKKIVKMIILLNVIFTLSVFYAFIKIGSEPSTLIIAWFAFTTGELWMLSSIKKKEVKADVEVLTSDCEGEDFGD